MVRLDDLPPDAGPPTERLVLDLGGVVLPSAMPQIIRELTALSGRSEQSLWRFFNTRLYQPFWSGQMSIEDFWATFTEHAGVPGIAGRWQTEMTVSMLTPLAGVARVQRWATVLPVGVLSNQRAEWVLPVLRREGLLDLFDPLLVSSATGLVKPDSLALAQLADLGTPPERVLYVDDRPQALRRAERYGVTTFQAHGDGAWMDWLDDRFGLGPP